MNTRSHCAATGRRTRWAALLSVLLVAFGWASSARATPASSSPLSPTQAKRPQQESRSSLPLLTLSRSILPLKAAFNRDVHSTRLLLLVSPT
jgi:hypothetical protein